MAASAHAGKLRASPGKLYLQIATLMRRQIETGKWAAGARLPPIKQLAAEYGVALVTVRQAIAILEDDRLLARHQGRGTFVAEKIAAPRWVRLDWNLTEFIHRLQHNKPRLLKVTDTIGKAPVEPADGHPAPAYRYMRRVHFSDRTPYAVIDIYLDRRVYQHAPKKFESEMVIPLLAGIPGLKLREARQVMTIGTADLETATLLEIPVNAPIGEVRRAIRDADGCVIYLGIVAYRGDVVRLESRLPIH
ncbi:MAG: GntR family transcriptional regulator [Pseudomonadota bacterium]